MKGVILAGGKGSRLSPCTNVINKHLLPINNKPMIYYPIETLVKAGCSQIMIVVGGESPGEFMKLLKNGKEFGLTNIYYAYQNNPVGGIADALSLTREFVGKDKFIVILGDNILFDNLSECWTKFMDAPYGTSHIFLQHSSTPESFGVAELKNNKVVNLVEKPTHFVSNNIVIGVYMYDNSVFDVIQRLIPSKRGELEITDVNISYMRSGALMYEFIKGKWFDTGSFDSIQKVNVHLYRTCDINHNMVHLMDPNKMDTLMIYENQ
jgi:glucose-1-phosphate thymidylyltransferase